jgi:DNA-binding MarR family transcriptional regulator
MGDTKVRDLRSGFFWLNNEIFDNFLPEIGVNAFSVYAALTRFTNNETGTCHPSRQTIADKMKISVDTVDRSVKKLVAAGLVKVERVKVDKAWDHNVYTLLGVAAISGQGSRTDAEGVAAISGTNKTTNNQD